MHPSLVRVAPQPPRKSEPSVPPKSDLPTKDYRGEDRSDLRALRDYAKMPHSMMVYAANGQTMGLQNFWLGQSIFLILSGPSIHEHELGLLGLPGVMTFGVNNSWVIWRPKLWTFVDRPGSFMFECWTDSAIMKFAPWGKVNEFLHEKRGDEFVRSKRTVGDMPGVVFYRRNESFDPETFLDEPTVNWGCNGKKKDSLGIRGTRSVMLAALKLIYYLGFRNVYLLGCDFNMKFGNQYAFDQFKHEGGCSSNNKAYANLNRRFCAMRELFSDRRFKVYNCNKKSGLDAFPYKPFRDCVVEATEITTRPVTTGGWYDHDTPK